LAHVLAKRNAARAAEDPPKPALTAAEYIDNILVRRSLVAFNEERKRDLGDAVETAYNAATNAVQNQVKTLLGVV
jgi:hypothetical protein